MKIASEEIRTLVVKVYLSGRVHGYILIAAAFRYGDGAVKIRCTAFQLIEGPAPACLDQKHLKPELIPEHIKQRIKHPVGFFLKLGPHYIAGIQSAFDSTAQPSRHRPKYSILL